MGYHTSMKEDREHQKFNLGRLYFRMLKNFLGLQRNRLIDDLEEKVMQAELKKAKKKYDDFS